MIAYRGSGRPDRPLRIAIPKGALFADSVRASRRGGTRHDRARRPGPPAHRPHAGGRVHHRQAHRHPRLRRLRRRLTAGSAARTCSSKPVSTSSSWSTCDFGGCRFVVAEPENATARGQRAGAPPRRRARGDQVPQHHAGALRRARGAGRDRQAQRQHRARAAHRHRRRDRRHHRDRHHAAREPAAHRRRRAAEHRALRRQPGGRAHRPARARARRHAVGTLGRIDTTAERRARTCDGKRADAA